MLHIFLIFASIISLQSNCKAQEHEVCPVRQPIFVSEDDPYYKSKPYVNGNKQFMNGIISDYIGDFDEVTSPIYSFSKEKNEYTRTVIGTIAKMNTNDSERAINSAKAAWNNGQGTWPQMSINDRIQAMRKVVISLKKKREEIVNVLMWEIAKTVDDSYAEFGKL